MTKEANSKTDNLQKILNYSSSMVLKKNAGKILHMVLDKVNFILLQFSVTCYIFSKGKYNLLLFKNLYVDLSSFCVIIMMNKPN